MNNTILYEDNHLLVAKKDSDTLIKHKTKKDTLMNKLIHIFTSRDPEDKVWLKNLSLVENHIGGTVLFAKSSKAYTRLKQQLKKQTVRQLFFAVVDGIVKEDFGTVTHYIVGNSNQQFHLVGSDHPHGEQSTLTYHVVDRSGGLTLVAIPTKTGMTEQIRVQLMGMGHSIYGDRHYGKNKSKEIPLALWSVQLRCYHPTLKKKVSIVSAPPAAHPWNKFTGYGDIHSAIEGVYRGIKNN
ncbi:hypothetical protein HZY88_10780 [Aerococcaceae bacterium DSM 111176]|nr:hypothetical protein [Aerococcaceae bacterium DSM 111176]